MNESQNPLPVDLQSQLEQFEAASSQFAIIMVSYHNELLGQGMPPYLADRLVRDFHSIWWQTSLGSAASAAGEK